LRVRLNSVSISGVLLTLCLLYLVPKHLQFASTWRERHVWEADRFVSYNFESLLGFASLALFIIGLTVIWTGYQKRERTAWFIMLVFVCVYFLPVYLVDTFLDIRRVGWRWWLEVVPAAMEGRPFDNAAIRQLVILALMVIALLVPIRAFFGKKSLLPSGDQSKS
jgi:succinate dehydrogenase hydrophobic anchor subunit